MSSLVDWAARLSPDILPEVDAQVNAMAVWWRLRGPGGAEVSTCPRIASSSAATWASKRQAVYYFGFEVGVRKGCPRRGGGGRFHTWPSQARSASKRPLESTPDRPEFDPNIAPEYRFQFGPNVAPD